MFRKLMLLAGTMLVLSLLAAAPAFAADGDGEDDGSGDGGKVTICHIPPGNPGNAHTIRVGRAALDAHLAHGDFMGRCLQEGNEGEGNEGGQGAVVVPPVSFECDQDIDQTGNVNISTNVSLSGDNSNQSVAPLQFGNTGNIQNCQGFVQVGAPFGNFENDNNGFIICDFDSDRDGICDRDDNDFIVCDDFHSADRDCRRFDDNLVFFPRFDNEFGFNDGAQIGDVEFEGPSFNFSPTLTNITNQSIQQSAVATSPFVVDP